MISRHRAVPRAPYRLTLDQLESRETPAGNITATFNGNILRLTGDDLANSVTLRHVQDGIELIGVNTLINGEASATFDGKVKAISAVMKGGDDVIDIDAGAAFDLSGNAFFDLGDGANTLRLATSEALSIAGNVVVKAGEGFDNIVIDGDAASEIKGHIHLSLGSGGADVLVRNVSVLGRAGLSFLAGAGDNAIDLISTNVPKVIANVGAAGTLAVDVAGSTLGSLSLAAKNIGSATADLVVDIADSTIDGALRLKAFSGIDLDLDEVSIGRLDVSGHPFANVDVDISGAVDVLGNAIITGAETTVDIVDGTLDVAGNLLVDGRNFVETTVDATSSLIADGHLFVRSVLGDAVVAANGVAVTVGKNLAIFGRNLTDVTIDTSSLSKVFGHVFVRGGIADDLFDVSSNFDVGKHLSLSLGSGNNIIDLGDGARVLNIAGNLFVRTLDGIDQVTLNRVDIHGVTNMVLGAGDDILDLRNGTHFFGKVFADLGAGLDTLNFANLVDNTAAVIFGASALIRSGLGDDSLNLGLSASAGGNFNTNVIFEAANNVIDLGLGANVFVEADAQFDGALTFFGL